MGEKMLRGVRSLGGKGEPNELKHIKKYQLYHYLSLEFSFSSRTVACALYINYVHISTFLTYWFKLPSHKQGRRDGEETPKRDYYKVEQRRIK